MKKYIYLTLALGIMILTACETADDIIAEMDTQVPNIAVVSDSMDVNFGQAGSIKFTATDPSGIRRIDIAYGAWNIVEVIDFSVSGDYPTSYEHTINFQVPTDSSLAWFSTVGTGYYHNGTIYKYTDYFHDIEIKATDIHLNERKSYARVRVR